MTNEEYVDRKVQINVVLSDSLKATMTEMEIGWLARSKEIQEVYDKAVKEGKDAHQAVADFLKTSRQHAKNLNFARNYGGGKPFLKS